MRERAEEQEPVPLEDDADALLPLGGEDAAEGAGAVAVLGAALRRDRRWLLAQPAELRVAVGETRACGRALVDERVQDRKPTCPCGLCPGSPGLGDTVELTACEVGGREHVAGR